MKLKLITIFSLLACLGCNTQQHAAENNNMRDTFVYTVMDTLDISPFLVDYIGEYMHGKVISAKDGNLYYREIDGGKNSVLNRIGKDVFHTENNDATIHFYWNNYNQVMSFRVVWVGGRKEFCERKGPVYMDK